MPLNWDTDPYEDRNWCYQLHALRMLDSSFFNYDKDNNIKYLLDTLPIIEDWYQYSIVRANLTVMTWNDMATGLRALKIGYLINQLFRKENINLISEYYQDLLIKLAKIHLTELLSQQISLNNHGIFQAHGLVMLAWLLNDNNSVKYGLGHMHTLINQQFYTEGVHTENSDDYHWFIYKTFDSITKFEPYLNDTSIQKILKNADNYKPWTVFPNNQSLMIGDSGDSIRNRIKKPKDKKNKVITKYFKESGYLYVRSSFQTEAQNASMLFFQTAYKSKTHRHADDFNILLYEYGINILVDSGKYAYENNNNRIYAVSTRAHNCLMIDNKDYDIKGRETYDSALVDNKFEESIYQIRTSINREKIGVRHDRILLYKPKEFLIVIDKLDSKKKRKYDQFWHFHQDLELVQKENTIFTNIDDKITMKIEPTIVNLDKFNTKFSNDKLDIKLIKGQTEPELQGWRSLKYKEMIENYALQNSIEAKKALLITKFIFNEKNLEYKNLDIIVDNKENNISCFIKSKSFGINSTVIIN